MKLYKVLSKLPYFIQEIPYYIALYITKLVYYKYPLTIWSRNSFKQKNIVCALSDLDLTFIEHQDISTSTILQRYFLLKRFFPYLGEINYYSSKEIKSFIPFANPFELQRDSLLTQNIDLKIQEGDKLQKIVFFCKTLISDKENLFNIPAYRKKKWSSHAKALDFDLSPNLNLGFLVNQLYQVIDKHCQLDQRFLKEFYKIDLHNKKSINDFYLSNLDKKSFIILYPFIWIGAAFSFDSFYHDLEIISQLGKNESELLLEQVHTEIWGLYSQYKITDSQIILISHLENIKMMTKKIPLEENKKKPILEAIEKLNKLCNQKIENEN